MPFVLANIFQPLIDVFDAVIRFFHDQVGLSWGLSIIALTVVVRAILVPLTYKQMKSMQAMQKLAPEMKALQAKYKDDKQRQQQELMALYKEHQVNPFGSCLPLVAQMPVFLSLFYMLRHDLRHDICGQTLKACGKVGHPEKFLFVHDITDKATGGVLVVLDRPLHRLAAAVGHLHVEHGRPQPADVDAGPAVHLHDLHHPVPGGPDRLLDHHEPVDSGAGGAGAPLARHRKAGGPRGRGDAEAHTWTFRFRGIRGSCRGG